MGMWSPLPCAVFKFSPTGSQFSISRVPSSRNQRLCLTTSLSNCVNGSSFTCAPAVWRRCLKSWRWCFSVLLKSFPIDTLTWATRDFPPLEFEGLVMIQVSHLQLTVFTLSIFPGGNPSWLQVPIQGPPAMSSTEGEKDLNQGWACNEKTDTSNLQAGDQGPSCSPWQEDKTAPFSLHFYGRKSWDH